MGFKSIAVVALSGVVSLASAADVASYGVQIPTVTTMAVTATTQAAHTTTFVTMRKGDTFKISFPTNNYGFIDPNITGNGAYWCADAMPAVDIALTEGLECVAGLKACSAQFTGCVADSSSNDPLTTAGLELVFGTPETETVTAWARFTAAAQDDADHTINVFINVTVLGATHQASAFSAAYAAGTFVASSLLVATMALF